MSRCRPPLCALLALAAMLFAACGDDAGTSTSAGGPEQAGCRQVEAPPTKDVKLPAPKASAPTASGVAFETSCGSFTVTFDERAPRTAASFQYLAEQGFYDDTVFHRVVPGFVIQGGDPLGTSPDPAKVGTGGPGYSVDEQPPSGLAYTEGIVAMAKSEAEPPGRSGSQFYVVTGADAGLPTDYALVGKVTSGMETVQAIEALGQAGSDGPPTMAVVIESATPVEG